MDERVLRVTREPLNGALVRALLMKAFTPAVPGSMTVIPLSRMALYLASKTGSTFDASHGPLQISFMARQ